MAHPNKTRGDRYERDILAICHAAGYHQATRTRPGRMEDQGDIFLNRAATAILQTKDVTTPQWRDWLTELEHQRKTAGAHYAALVVKRRGTAGRPPLHLAVMPIDKMLELLADAGHREAAA